VQSVLKELPFLSFAGDGVVELVVVEGGLCFLTDCMKEGLREGFGEGVRRITFTLVDAAAVFDLLEEDQTANFLDRWAERISKTLAAHSANFSLLLAHFLLKLSISDSFFAIPAQHLFQHAHKISA
jgi:hypothetical protein